jgi:hypothetical protein
LAGVPFEDPRKQDLEGRVRIALDAAGYSVADDIVAIELPLEAGLRGKLRGDIQTIGERSRSAFFVRPDSTKAVPQWIANLARAAHDVDDTRVYIVVEEVTGLIEQSCKACGAGLLVLKSTDEYELEMVVRPEDYEPADEDASFRAEIRSLRRRLESKLKLNLEAATSDFLKVRELTVEVAAEIREEYLSAVEDSDARWREWGDRISARLDEALSTKDRAELEAIGRLIERGIDEDEDAA